MERNFPDDIFDIFFNCITNSNLKNLQIVHILISVYEE